MKKLKTVLKRLGFDDDQIATLTAEAQDFDATEMANAARDVIAENLANDEAFLSPIENRIRGKVLSSKENKIMKLAGISKEEYDALPEKTRFDSLVQLAADKLKETGKGEAGADEATKKELQKLRDQVGALSDEKKTLNEKLQAEAKRVDARLEQVETEREVHGQLGKLKLIIDPADAAELAMSKLGKLYDIKTVDGKRKLFKKGTELEATDPETQRKVSFGSELERIAKASKWVAENGGAPAGGGTTKDDDEQKETGGMRKVAPPSKELPGMAAAREAAAARAKSGKAKADAEA